MKNNKHHIDDLQHLKANPFKVPVDYFETSQKQILDEVFLASLKSDSDQGGFEIPADYASDFASRLQVAIQLEALKSETPGFVLPEAYFENSAAEITQKIQLQKQTSLKLPKRRKLWFNYAAAASVLMMLTVGLYVNNEFKANNTAATAAPLEDQILHSIDEQMIISLINDSEPAAKPATAANAEVEGYILSNFSSADLISEL